MMVTCTIENFGIKKRMAILNAVHKILNRMLLILLLDEIAQIQFALQLFKNLQFIP